MYEVPKFNSNNFYKLLKNQAVQGVFLVAVIVVAAGFITNTVAPDYLQSQILPFFQNRDGNFLPQIIQEPFNEQSSRIEYEQAIIKTVQETSPSVVSIVISKNLPVYEQQFSNPFGNIPGFEEFQVPEYIQKGTKKQEVGAGSGFVVSEDGLI